MGGSQCASASCKLILKQIGDGCGEKVYENDAGRQKEASSRQYTQDEMNRKRSRGKQQTGFDRGVQDELVDYPTSIAQMFC